MCHNFRSSSNNCGVCPSISEAQACGFVAAYWTCAYRCVAYGRADAGDLWGDGRCRAVDVAFATCDGRFSANTDAFLAFLVSARFFLGVVVSSRDQCQMKCLFYPHAESIAARTNRSTPDLQRFGAHLRVLRRKRLVLRENVYLCGGTSLCCAKRPVFGAPPFDLGAQSSSRGESGCSRRGGILPRTRAHRPQPRLDIHLLIKRPPPRCSPPAHGSAQRAQRAVRIAPPQVSASAPSDVSVPKSALPAPASPFPLPQNAKREGRFQSSPRARVPRLVLLA